MLPQAFLERMQELLGTSYDDFYASISENAVRALRVNTDKISVQACKAVFGNRLREIPYAQDGFIADVNKIGNHPLHHSGAFYVQDPGAMATVHAAAVQPSWRVADFCASPGGKSSQLSAYIGKDGFLLSNEINHQRSKVLAGNLERLGCTNTVVTNTDTATLASWFDAWFDLVLVDAPCSGEGMFRKYDQAKTEWSEENVRACAVRQRAILSDAARTVKNGGYLLYSTCTFSLEENEMNVDWFLQEHPSFQACEVDNALQAVTAEGIAYPDAIHKDALRLARRFYPHLFAGEGQFICLMQKKEAENAPAVLYRTSAQEKLSAEEEKITRDFLRSVLSDEGYLAVAKRPLWKYKDSVFVAHEVPIPPSNVIMPGVILGSIVKGRFDPHHNLFTAYGNVFARKALFLHDDDTVRRYLRGETFATDLADGYAAVLVNGAALGGIKAVGGVAKNHYPKGLRLP